MLTDKV